jgi:hypothetical protein
VASRWVDCSKNKKEAIGFDSADCWPIENG